MLKVKLVISVLLITHARTENPEPGETSRTQDETTELKWRHELREKIVESLIDVEDFQNDSLSSPSGDIHFDPCSPEIDRSLLCEALNIRMNKRTRRIIDEPCQNQGTGYAHFKCTTEDAVILHLKTRHMENEASLEIRGHVYKVFTVPTNIQPLLVNPFYERYNSLDKWIRERKPTSGEISSRMEETDFPTAYKLALQLEIVVVTEEFQRTGNPKGPPLCYAVFSRGVYCEAVNIRMYGHTFPIRNSPCLCSSSGVPYFSCRMANGDVLSMERGDNEADIYLRNNENKIIYIVKSLRLHELFLNKYVLPATVTDKREMMDLWKQMLPAPVPNNLMEVAVARPDPAADILMADNFVNIDRCTIS